MAIAATYVKTDVSASAPAAAGDSVSWVLYACLPSGPITLAPGQSALVGTGVSLTYDAGYMGVLASNNNATFALTNPSIVVGSANEIKCIVQNSSTQAATISHGAPIANLWFVAITTGTISA